jgi:hypothetical protein
MMTIKWKCKKGVKHNKSKQKTYIQILEQNNNNKMRVLFYDNRHQVQHRTLYNK